jgi:hypothetical protein
MFISFVTYLQFLSETRIFYEFLILWCWFYNILVISIFELHDVNFIGVGVSTPGGPWTDE